MATVRNLADDSRFVDTPLYSDLDEPANKYVLITSGEEFSVCRALLVGTAGTATLVDIYGNERADVPLQAGYNPIRATKVTLGTAANVWALY